MDIFNGAMRAAAEDLKAKAKQKSYKTDPVAWAEDVLGIMLWEKQKEILRSVAQNKRTAVKSSHSIGKTYICAVAACWWVATREDSMVQSTAPTYQQVHSLLWEEIRKAHLRANLKGRVTLGDQWLVPMAKDGRQKDTLVAEGKKPADSNIHGFHGTHRPDGVLAILDEACGVHESIFTGAEAITTSPIDRILAVGNPDDPNTEFGRIFTEAASEWNLITVSAYDTPNFTEEGEQLIELARKLDKDPALVKAANEKEGRDDYDPHMRKVMAILDHMPDPDWIESRRRDWGEDSPRFLSKVLAQFPLTSMDSLFSASDIENGRNTVIEPTPNDFRVLAVDVARYGSDRTVLVSSIGGHVEVLGAYSTMDTMEVAATVHKRALDMNADQVRVDGVGVGGGVVDRLVALSYSVENRYVVVEMTASASPPDRTLHRNSRAYWYDSVKTQLGAGLIDLPIEFPLEFSYTTEDGNSGTIVKSSSEYAKELQKELTGIKYAYPNGIMQIESKEDIRRRGDKSPDFADAFVMACAPISYITNDPLATYRPGEMVEIDVLDDIEVVSLY